MIDQLRRLPCDYLTLTQAQQQWLWSIQGPALLDCDWSPAHPDWWQPPSAYPPQAAHFTSPRLGFRFEQLWQQYIELMDWPAQFNLQIRSAERTLGELDALLKTPQGVMHLELALKFYLGFGDDWIGPNRRDRLADKIRHTRDHQLAMAQQPETRAALDPEWQPSQSQALMRGCLFHAANPAFRGALPAEVNAEHWRGYWCHIQDAPQLLPQGQWYILSKPDWISPMCAPLAVDRDTLLHYCQRHFQSLDGGLCAALLQYHQGQWIEQQRWMLMANDWPRSG